jgi:2-iminoacetate synthase
MSSHFIDREYIENLLEEAKSAAAAVGDAAIGRALDKAERFEGLDHREIAALLVS